MMYVGDSAGPVAVNAIGTQLHYLILADSGLTQWTQWRAFDGVSVGATK